MGSNIGSEIAGHTPIKAAPVIDRDSLREAAPEASVWSLARANGTKQRKTAGLDVLLTKAAVEFQHLNDTTDADLKRDCEALRDALAVDAFLIAQFDADHERIERVIGAAGMYAAFNPEVLQGEPLNAFPYLWGQLEPMRIVELRDTQAARAELSHEAARFAQLGIGAVLLIGLAVKDRVCGFMAVCATHPRETWDANLHLALKLLGASYASGLERQSFERHLSNLEERNDLALHSANDGLWDFDAEKNTTYFSPRWQVMFGFDDDEHKPPQDWRQLIHPDDLERVQGELRDYLGGTAAYFESTHRMRHRNGAWRWVVSRATASRDESGRMRRLVGVELDIFAVHRRRRDHHRCARSSRLLESGCRTVDGVGDRRCLRQAGRRDLSQLPRRDLRTAGKSFVSGDSARSYDQVGSSDFADSP
jgi:PAS domain S-box-containing protein